MKKRLLSILISLTLFTSSFALPGFTSYLPDESGAFVYYKDNSFVRDSYVGILMYNENSFQIRYFAPEDKENHLEQMDIRILVSIDPSSNYWNMTGERLITPISNTEEEIDILNYLHDILYEFSSRRNKVSDITPDNPNFSYTRNFLNDGIPVSQEYQQFGGKVYITFDPIVPLFNIKSISDPNGKILLECATFGKIKSSDDNCFESFMGFKKPKFSTKLEKLDKNAKKVTYTNEWGQSIELDKNWKNYSDMNMDYLYTFGDEAIIIMMPIEYEGTEARLTFYSTIREYLSSANSIFSDLKDTEIKLDSKNLSCNMTTYSTDYDNSQITITRLSKQSEKNAFKNLMFISFLHPYTVRKSYYDNIIKSYSSTN